MHSADFSYKIKFFSDFKCHYNRTFLIFIKIRLAAVNQNNSLLQIREDADRRGNSRWA